MVSKYQPFFQRRPFKEKRNKRKKPEDKFNNIEDEYEKEIQEESQRPKKTRHLLPIKTKEGLVRRTVEEEGIVAGILAYSE